MSETQQRSFEVLDQALRGGQIVPGHGATGPLIESQLQPGHKHADLGAHAVTLVDGGTAALGDAHAAYLTAGAGVVESFLWGPQPSHYDKLALDRFGKDGANLAQNAHRTALKTARAFGDDGSEPLVIGTFRPAGDCYERPTLGRSAIGDLHKRQAARFAAANVRHLLLQTFPGVEDEVEPALAAIASETDATVVGASAYYEEDDRGRLWLPSGESLQAVADIASHYGIWAGANCVAPHTIGQATAELAASGQPVYLGPNALEVLLPNTPPATLWRLARGNRRGFLHYISDAVREARAAHVGALITGCCYTDQTWTKELAQLAAHANADRPVAAAV